MVKWFGALAAAVVVSGQAMASPIDVCPAQVAYNRVHKDEINALEQQAVLQDGIHTNNPSEWLCIEHAMQLKALMLFRTGLDLCQDHTGEYATVSASVEGARLKLIGDLRSDGCPQVD